MEQGEGVKKWLIAVILRACGLLGRIPPELAPAEYSVHGANTSKGTAVCTTSALGDSV